MFRNEKSSGIFKNADRNNWNKPELNCRSHRIGLITWANKCVTETIFRVPIYRRNSSRTHVDNSILIARRLSSAQPPRNVHRFAVEGP